MLNRKNFLILAGVLIVLIVISVAQKRRPTEPSTVTLIDGELARADLSRLSIGHGGESDVVVLESGSDGWLLRTAWNAKASEQRLDSLLRNLSNLRGEFRSDSEAVLTDYGFDEAITIRGFDPGGNETFAVEVGSKPEGGQGNFIRLPGSARVYLTSANLLSDLGLWNGPGRPESRHFLELQAYRAERQAVDRLKILGEAAFELVKEFEVIEPAEDDTVSTEPFTDRSQWEWRLIDRDGDKIGMAVKTKADGVLGAAVSIRAQDVVDPGAGLAAYGLEEPAKSVTITMESGEEVTLNFGDKRETEGTTPGGYYMVAPELAPTVWVVGEFNVNNIFKTVAELMPEE